MARKRIRGRHMDELSPDEAEQEISPRQETSRSRARPSSSVRTGHRASNRRVSFELSSERIISDEGAISGEGADEGTSNIPASGSRVVNKKPRGPAKSIKEWGTGKKLLFEWNEHYQPIGPKATSLASQLGVFARDSHMLPLTVTSWDVHDQGVLDSIWEDIKENTNAPEEYKRNAMSTISERWRAWKHRVKSDYYMFYDTDDERRENKPPELERSQWETLIKYWGRNKTQEYASLNKECRGTPVAVHRTGRTSFSNIRHKMALKGESTTRPDVWRATRRKKDGTFDEKDGARDYEEQLTSKLSELTQEAAEDPEEIDKVFKKVIGGDGHGRVRTFGAGVSPSIMQKSSSSSAQNEVTELRSEIAELKKKVDERDENLRQSIMAELLARMQNGSLSSFGGHFSSPEDARRSTSASNVNASPMTPIPTPYEDQMGDLIGEASM